MNQTDLYLLVEENFSAIIGVCGTLAGVIVGFVLEKASRWGRIKIFQNELTYFIINPSSSGDNHSSEKVTQATESLSIYFSLELFNTSEFSKKIMRDIKFTGKNNHVLGEIFDQETHSPFADSFKSDKWKIVHLEPRRVQPYNLRVEPKKNLKGILESEWFIIYKDHKNKEKKIKINKSLLNNRKN